MAVRGSDIMLADMALPVLVTLGYLLWKGGGAKGLLPEAKKASSPQVWPSEERAPEKQKVIHRPMTAEEKKRYPTMTTAEKAKYGGYASQPTQWGTDEEALLARARASKKKK
jgi:hypothetical protein